jgi:hypothetical protein
VIGRSAAPALLPIGLGLTALATSTAFGWDERLVAALATPPAVVRAALAGGAVVVGARLLGRAIARLGASETPLEAGGQRDLVALTRGVRLAFLAVAAFAAAAGWILGHPLPIVVALVIAGVDVVETSFLLLVIVGRGRNSAEPPTA